MIQNHRSLITITIIVLLVFLISQCVNKEEDEPGIIKNADGEQFSGSSVCANCHKNIYDTHLKTAHYLTSQPASEKFIKGSFEDTKNKFSYNYSVVVAMEKRDSGLYQVEYFRGVEKKARRFDIVIGSGTMGQSYLYWMHHKLFQLPITYFTAADAWSNSPGFPDKVVFNRSITSRCLECHATFVKTISAPGKEPEEFDNDRIIFGVDCEKCHGPAAKHVEFHTKNPKDTGGMNIINPAVLSREQSLDLCASCHGGRLQKLKPSFEFTVGDTLSDYFTVDTSAPDPENIDVHGNQYGLLRASKCFRMSEMNCNSCHNTHKNEKGNMALFSQRCMTCHNNDHGKFCKVSHTAGLNITTNCVDCHMPLKPSKAIAVQLKGGTRPIAALIRSHYISVYAEETKKFIEEKNKISKQ